MAKPTPVPAEQGNPMPSAGGSYLRDPVTGALSPNPDQPQPTPPASAEADEPAKKDV